jgi:hypothetical protein
MLKKLRWSQTHNHLKSIAPQRVVRKLMHGGVRSILLTMLLSFGLNSGFCQMAFARSDGSDRAPANSDDVQSRANLARARQALNLACDNRRMSLANQLVNEADLSNPGPQKITWLGHIPLEVTLTKRPTGITGVIRDASGKIVDFRTLVFNQSVKEDPACSATDNVPAEVYTFNGAPNAEPSVLDAIKQAKAVMSSASQAGSSNAEELAQRGIVSMNKRVIGAALGSSNSGSGEPESNFSRGRAAERSETAN